LTVKVCTFNAFLIVIVVSATSRVPCPSFLSIIALGACISWYGRGLLRQGFAPAGFCCVPGPRASFAEFRFPPDVITLAVRWCLRCPLSYRGVDTHSCLGGPLFLVTALRRHRHTPTEHALHDAHPSTRSERRRCPEISRDRPLDRVANSILVSRGPANDQHQDVFSLVEPEPTRGLEPEPTAYKTPSLR
jgi:hypothetical protein